MLAKFGGGGGGGTQALGSMETDRETESIQVKKLKSLETIKSGKVHVYRF